VLVDFVMPRLDPGIHRKNASSKWRLPGQARR
jgi:hypothetical protein